MSPVPLRGVLVINHKSNVNRDLLNHGVRHPHRPRHLMSRVGQNHIYTVYIRYLWQGNHQIYGHIRCINTVLTNPTNERCERRAPSRGSCRGTACEG